MPRELLIHLNVQTPDSDGRPVEEIVEAIKGALEVGMDDESVAGLIVEVALAEEI